MSKRALIHVENTENLLELVEYLVSADWTIISANETEDFLRKQKIPVTHEQELVPNNYNSHDTSKLISHILKTKDEDVSSIYKGENDNNIHIICMNINPSLNNYNEFNATPASVKPSNFYVSAIIRNSFINYENLIILTDPLDYKEAIVQLRTNNITKEFRLYLAAKAMNLVSAYDSAISSSLLLNTKLNNDFVNYMTFPFKKEVTLKGGINPQQNSCLYKYPDEPGLFSGFYKIQGRELDYNIISDVSLAWEQVSFLFTTLRNQFNVKSTNSDGYDFTTQLTPLTGTVFTIAVKFKSIVGAALSDNVQDSFKKTYTYDKRNIKNVTLACSAVIDEEAAKEIVNCNFAAVVAPGFTTEAKQVLAENRNIRLIPAAKLSNTPYDIELINGGLLVQTRDTTLFNHWNVKTKHRPSQIQADEMAFGMLLVAGSRSYSATLIKDNSIVGIAQCSTSSVMSVEDVYYEAKRHTARNNPGSTEKLADILVCDSAFPFCDIVKKIIDSGVTAIIQTGGTESDEELINYCNEHDVVMVYTGITHISY